MAVIGLLGLSRVFMTDNPFEDKYIFSNNFVKAIIDNGGIVMPILFHDNELIPGQIEKCDGLLIPGGTRIIPVYFEIIDYFYKKKKPILGVCMGMQALAMYSVNNKKIIQDIETGVNHQPHTGNRIDRFITAHKNTFVSGSLLNRLFGNECDVNSYHQKTINEVGENFKITSWSSDGLIEGIECQDRFAVGVQFHVEHMRNGDLLFKEFIDACKK